jgi:4'-phosphopantetheinyl transferase
MTGNGSADRTAHDPLETGGLIPLTPAEIHVWLAFYDEIADERLHSAYRELLNAAEREQEPRFYFARDRRRYLVTRALVRTVLSRYIPVDPKGWVFSTNRYGRPDIANPEARDACVSFNISHTHHLVVLGSTRGRALGVDVENVREREAPIEVAHRFFSPQEVAGLSAIPADQQTYRFFEYWTFKESYIKARGMGLSLPLDKFSFHYPSERAVEIAIDSELADNAARWQFWQFQPRPEYLVAICAERIGSQTPDVIVREVIPMRSERQSPLHCLRIST